MTALSNIDPQDRLAALRFANQALDALDAIHAKWILWEKTRPAATALKLINTHLQLLVTKLGDATADHCLVAHDLGVIVAQLMAVNHESPLKPLFYIALARQKIGEHT
jgi:predicted alpha/beta hydrolase family esterase